MNKLSGIKRLEDNAFIPIDENNRDYQEYLKHVKENDVDGKYQEHIIIHNEDGSFKSFPVSLDNPEYLNFKEHIDEYELVKESE